MPMKLQVSYVDHSALDRRSLQYIGVINEIHREVDKHWGLRTAMGIFGGRPNPSIVDPEAAIHPIDHGNILAIHRLVRV